MFPCCGLLTIVVTSKGKTARTCILAGFESNTTIAGIEASAVPCVRLTHCLAPPSFIDTKALRTAEQPRRVDVGRSDGGTPSKPGQGKGPSDREVEHARLSSL